MRERDKTLLRAILCGRAWNGFFLGQAKKEDVPYRLFVVKVMDMVICFWARTFPPSLHVRELPEFASLLCL